MDFFKIIGIAIALATDASIIAFSYGLILRSRRFAQSLKLAFVTGAFQAIMPLIGFWLTGKIHKYIEACDHWLAFFVFGTLGSIIIINAWRGNGEGESGETKKQQTLSAKQLLGIGVATSIDALAIGAGMACMSGTRETSFVDSIGIPAGVIGIVTFACVFAAFHSTRIFKHFPKRAIETAAGLILIALGVVTLVQHTCP